MLGDPVRINIDAQSGLQSSESESGLILQTGTCFEPGRHGERGPRAFTVSDKMLSGCVKLRVTAIIHNGQEFTVVAAPEDVVAYEPVLRELLRGQIKGQYRIQCLYEKSCGAIIYRRRSGNIEYLLIKNKKGGNWGFPKGHIERGETEHDTAKREVEEETGLRINPLPDFRAISEYHPRGRIYKKVVFFLAEMPEDGVIEVQQTEIDRFIWADYSLAMRTFRFNNDRNILTLAKNWLNS